MKTLIRIVLIAIVLILCTTAVSATNFSAEWNTATTSSGSSSSTQIKLPLADTGTYDFTVWWGDGNSNHITVWNQAEVTHTYSSSGVYTINISSGLDGFRFNNVGDKLKIQDVFAWGDLLIGDAGGYFYGCAHLSGTPADTLNISSVTDMASMFRLASAFNQSIGNWDVSSVTDMGFMFYSASMFNQNLSTWDVSSVTDMRYLFYLAIAFNQNISTWNVSSVTDMPSMFRSASVFNQSISTWNVSSVTDMEYMFREATDFNRDIGDWDVSSVINMGYMFYLTAFNQNLSTWDVSSATDMRYMFASTAFNQPICNWDVSSVLTMASMFRSISVFNQNLSTWDVANVTSMEYMFYDTAFDQNISAWTVSSVLDMGYMFAATPFNRSLISWDVSSVTDMASMFYLTTDFNLPLSTWDVSNVLTMASMFRSTSVFNQNLSTWDVSSVTDMGYMFREAAAFDQNISTWDVSNVDDMRYMFYFTSFNQSISAWNVSSVINMASMFRLASVFNQNVSNWNVSNVGDMQYMFRSATVFNQSISNWDVSSVDDMRYMFYLTAFNQYIGGWDVSSVLTTRYMFASTPFNQNISAWNVSSVTNMERMFYLATDFNQDIGGWNVSSVTSMESMFSGVTLSTINYDALLIGWSTLPLQSNVVFHGGNSKYSAGTAANARNNTLVGIYIWSITDGGKAPTPIITAYYPTVTIWPEVNDSQLFNVTVNQNTQCRWYMNGSLKQTNSSLSLTHSYTNTSLNGGGCNVTAVVNNTNGDDSQTWLFEVGADSVSYIVLKDQPTNQTLILEINVTRVGGNVTDWGIYQNHTFSGWQYFFRFTNGTEIMNQPATSDNESLWFNHTSLLPIGVYYIDATLDTNEIILYANEYGLINNWTSPQNCSQIDANTSNMVCGSWYNHTSGLWESYRSGYGYNADAEIPENNSAFIFVDAQTTVSATPHTGGVTIQNATWFYGMLPGSTAKTLTEIETAMDSDSLDVWCLYGWSNATQAYTATGGYSVAPNEGYAVYCNVSGEYTP